MRILFIHQNFPGQFGRLAQALAARPGNEVRALATNRRPPPPGVKVDLYPLPSPVPGTFSRHPSIQEIETKVLRGDACAAACRTLRGQGFVPDVIIGHPGWGEMLRLAEVFPAARIISYAEFFFKDRGSDHDFDPEFRLDTRETALRRTLKNAVMDVAVRTSEASVTPTQWQASGFPGALRERLHVIHDGIDTHEIRPRPNAWIQVGSRRLTRADRVITFTTRYLEPLRGIHSFLRALPRVMERDRHAQVIVVGREDGGYWSRPPGPSHRERFLAEVRDRVDLSRIHFFTWVERQYYLPLLAISSAHVYLTYPFVLSWSLMEAMATGASIIGSNTPPVAEVITDGVTGRLVDFHDTEALADRILESLEDAALRQRLGLAARATIVRQYDQESVCLPRWLSLIDRVAAGPQRFTA
ncbi:glycosyltransferase [Pararhodospirillum oryzae]|nr:glycosyltransferase [Pararhodospirillum oryzae]